MSLLDKILGKVEAEDQDEQVTVKTKLKMRRVSDLKEGDEIEITQRVRITDIRDADDRRIGSVARNKVIFMEVQAIGGVFNNLKAVATASEKDQVQMASGQVKAEQRSATSANAAPKITVDNDRDEDEMHGSFSTLRS